MIINLSYLEDITGGDKEMILEMLDLFIRDIPVHIQKMESYFSEKKLEGLAREAHKLKPTLQYIGLTGMFENIKLIEQMAKLGHFEENQLEELIESLKEDASVCIPELINKRKELS